MVARRRRRRRTSTDRPQESESSNFTARSRCPGCGHDLLVPCLRYSKRKITAFFPAPALDFVLPPFFSLPSRWLWLRFMVVRSFNSPNTSGISPAKGKRKRRKHEYHTMRVEHTTGTPRHQNSNQPHPRRYIRPTARSPKRNNTTS